MIARAMMFSQFFPQDQAVKGRQSLPAVFLWGGKRRSDPVRRLRVESGDVAVWGGPARFVYHGVAPLKDGQHPLTGAARLNLTFRKVF